MALSPRQQRTYEFIKGYIASNGQAPKFTEIAKYFNYRSWATVHRILGLLEAEGLIKRNPRLKRGIELVPLKRCPTCCRELLINEFGLCRARKDGRNLYCKACIRKKVYAGRAVLREYKAIRRRAAKLQIQIQPELATTKDNTKVAPVDRVRAAIRKGAQTQVEIAKMTKLYTDQIGDALAILMLWRGEIRSVVVEGQRVYLPVQPEVERKPCKPALPLMEFARCLGPRAKITA